MRSDLSHLPIAISLGKVTKQYKLFSSPQARLKAVLHPFRTYHRLFSAIKDVSFDIPRGQSVGIIGSNGSGKSTLLQMIAGVSPPSAGNIIINGKISALLELGAGFNPEFTGRENVLLSGVLSGFSRAEMKGRLPEIERFADIGDFIDQPVKTYSTGMFIRLAFAAAIHVDPDILLIDEALAVGDARFQHKCYQKIHEFKGSGKTILFVTHDMQAITRLCDQAILLDHGSILRSGEPQFVVHAYHELILSGGLSEEHHPTHSRSPLAEKDHLKWERLESALNIFLNDRPEKEGIKFRKNYNRNEYRFGDGRGEIIDYAVVANRTWDPSMIDSGEWIDIYMKVHFHRKVLSPLYGFSMKSIDGIYLYGTNSRFQNYETTTAEDGTVVVVKFSVQPQLTTGDYFVDLGLAERCPTQDVPIDMREGIIHLFVQQRDRFDGFVKFETHLEEIYVSSHLATEKRSQAEFIHADSL